MINFCLLFIYYFRLPLYPFLPSFPQPLGDMTSCRIKKQIDVAPSWRINGEEKFSSGFHMSFTEGPRRVQNP